MHPKQVSNKSTCFLLTIEECQSCAHRTLLRKFLRSRSDSTHVSLKPNRVSLDCKQPLLLDTLPDEHTVRSRLSTLHVPHLKQFDFVIQEPRKEVVTSSSSYSVAALSAPKLSFTNSRKSCHTASHWGSKRERGKTEEQPKMGRVWEEGERKEGRGESFPCC